MRRGSSSDGGADNDEAKKQKVVTVNGLEVNQERDDPEYYIAEGGTDDEAQVEWWTGMGTEAFMDPAAIKAAKTEEIEFMRRIGVFETASREECMEKTGRQPVSTKWVVVDKGKEVKSDVRCRLVARDFKPKGEKDRIDLFAAMPPWEAKSSRWGPP